MADNSKETGEAKRLPKSIHHRPDVPPRITAERRPGARLAPDDEALAAIVAALEQTFASAPTERGPVRPGWHTSTSPPWRFSGRWWSGPAALRRERPGR